MFHRVIKTVANSRTRLLVTPQEEKKLLQDYDNYETEKAKLHNLTLEERNKLQKVVDGFNDWRKSELTLMAERIEEVRVEGDAIKEQAITEAVEAEREASAIRAEVHCRGYPPYTPKTIAAAIRVRSET